MTTTLRLPVDLEQRLAAIEATLELVAVVETLADGAHVECGGEDHLVHLDLPPHARVCAACIRRANRSVAP